LNRRAGEQETVLIYQDSILEQRNAAPKIAPRGFEPLNDLKQGITNKEVIQNPKTHSDIYSDNSLQKTLRNSPELKQIIHKWAELSKDGKKAILDIVRTES
jgi:hypothetical protein